MVTNTPIDTTPRDLSEITDPLVFVRDALARAAEAGEPFAGTKASLATVSSSGRPSVRHVLIKDVREHGFPFFTHYGSRKAKQLAACPHAALSWHWNTLGEQVCVEGSVSVLPDRDSDAYFSARPEGSQIGAWASVQSDAIPSKEHLGQQVEHMTRRMAGSSPPRPPFWGGYLLTPQRVELWREGKSRLHQRLLFIRPTEGASTQWERKYLSP